MVNTVEKIKSALELLSDRGKKQFCTRVFKIGKGEYAEGDEFIGVTVSNQRKVAKEFVNKITLDELQNLMSSKIHEHRHIALLILVYQYEKSKTREEKDTKVRFYLQNLKFINNWDLVDVSCYKILGAYCFETKKHSILLTLSEEENLWSKRIAVVSTMYYIKRDKFDLLKTIVLKNLHHPHDLIHKANGWLLRQMGKKNETELLNFLDIHYHIMPRTTLRYALEKLKDNVRYDYLKGKR